MFPFLGPLVGIFTLPPFSISGVLDLPYFSGVASNHKLSIQIKTRQAMKERRKRTPTQQGQPKTVFALVDEAGTWLRCCALGRNAVSPALVNGNEVVLYFGAGRNGRGSSPGLVWLFKDACVVLLGPKGGVKRLELELK